MHFLVFFALSISAYAEDLGTEIPDRDPAAQAGNPACNALKNACLRAGYTMQAPQTSDKSVIGGCMAKIARDEQVPRLMVKATDPAIKPCVDFMKGKITQIKHSQAKALLAPSKPASGTKSPANPPKKPNR